MPATDYDPQADDAADRVKRCYARSTELLALMQHRLAELAGAGRLNVDESALLQRALVEVWSELYDGTVMALAAGPWASPEDEPEVITYSDGRHVILRAHVTRDSRDENDWKFNGFLIYDGAVIEFPKDAVAVVDERLSDGTHPEESDGFAEYLKGLLQAPLDGWDEV